ncbi:hypothetical protein LUZ60_006294 [Juncus effusus]|nr:hypothetical protein LUZ60_006294 [Juncus effusus]
MEVLESDMWEFSECENSILPLLKLSYNHLPTQIKRCFAYCSVFPKGHVFERDRLVQLWIAHDFIESRGGKRRVEDIGDEYIRVLFSRSFFQYCDWKENPQNFVMHDLIHDLAESVSEKGYFRTDKSTYEYNKTGQQSLGEIFSKLRHCVVLSNVIANPINFKPFCEATSLRTLYLNRFSVCRKYPNALIDLTQRLKCLRALHLNSENLTELPESLGQLKSLRYLMVIAENLKHLPDSISCLYNLKTLRLDETTITRLPKGISKLVNLRHLDLPEWGPLPKGFGRLTNLQSLQSFTLTRRLDFAGIEELKDLNPRGTLEISRLEKVFNFENVKRANLQKKEHISALNLKWGNEKIKNDEIFKYLGYDCRKTVLKTLRPHMDLHKLEIQNYIGIDFPTWIGESSFNKLTSIRLFQGCFQEPPTLGTLSSLKTLHIENVSGIQNISRKFFDGGFPSLELLEMHGLRDFRGWCGAEEGELARLKELNISNCYYATSLALDNLKSLEKVGIHTCPMLSSLNLPNSKHLGLRHFSYLKNLEIIDCSLYSISSRDQLPPYLQLLNIHNSERLVDWCGRNVGSLMNIYKVKGMNNRELALTNVLATNEAKNIYFEHVRILNLKWDPTTLESRGITHDTANEILQCLCPRTSLTNLTIEGYIGSQFPHWLGNPQFSNIVYVRLTACPNCTILPPLGQLPYLMGLYLDTLTRVKTIGSEFYGNGTTKGFPSLRNLELMHMNGLDEWWGSEHGEFPTLQEIRIADAGMLRGLPRFIATLKEMKIKDCPSLILDLTPSNYSSLQILCASHIHSVKLSNNLTSLTDLLLDGCMDCRLAQLPSLHSLAMKEIEVKAFLDSLQGMNNITSLKISSLANLTMIPLHNQPILTKLDISNCPDLVSISCFSTSCSSSSSWSSSASSSSSLSSQDSIFEGLQSLSSLKFLSVSSYPRLSFSTGEWLPISLEALKVFDCPMVKSWCQKYPNRVSHIRHVTI